MITRSVNWVKNTQNNEWFDLLRLNLNSNYFINKRGVYIIWYTSTTEAKVIRLGQGDIGVRLIEHTQNPNIIRYSQLGQLKVTWAVVDNITLFENDLDGVEAYLSDQYNPIEGEKYPNVIRIPINLLP